MGGFAMSYRPKEPVTASSRWLRFFPEGKAPAPSAVVTNRIGSVSLSPPHTLTNPVAVRLGRLRKGLSGAEFGVRASF
jgi:hypothetical protein